MSRVIKFRAWDSEKQRLVGPYGLGDDHWPSNVSDIWEVMQYTGLKDKNGTDLYEGDVVERYWSDGSMVNHIHVRWLDDHCGWSINPALLEATKHNQQTGMTAHGFEIIGNIYENPELLEPKS